MARTTPVNSGYTIINGSTSGSNGSKVDTWIEYSVLSQSVAENESTVRVVLYSQATISSTTKWEVASNFGYVQVDNGTQQYLSTTYDFSNKAVNKFADYTFTIPHNTDGSKIVTLNGVWSTSHSSYISGGTVSGAVTLPTIPQYATSNETLGNKSETEITINWSSDNTIDYVWYAIDGGSTFTAVGSVNATSGSYTITGLLANTTYAVVTRVRNASSQLTTDSSALSVSTYNYPYASSMPNFSIGDSLTIGFYNPLGRTFTIYLIANGTQISRTWTCSGTTLSGFNDATAMTQLYATIPTSQSASYAVKCEYSGNTITEVGGTMSAKESDCRPAITAVSYQDTNASVVAVTGNNQKIIQNKSIVRYSATGLSANYSATISSCSVTVNNSTYALTISGSSASGGNVSINSSSALSATVTLTDSRGFTATKTVSIEILAYENPTAIITLARHNNYYSETDITVDADYSYIEGNNACTITYKARKIGTSSYTVTGTLSDNVLGTFTADNEYAWEVVVTLVDSLGGQTEYNLTLSKGMPIIYFDKDKSSVGINTFPVNNDALEIGGDVNITGGLTAGNVNILYGLMRRGTLTSANDLNDYYQANHTGLWYVGSSVPSNSPSGAAPYSHILILNLGITTQIWIRRQADSVGLYIRTRIGSPASWTSWAQIPSTDLLSILGYVTSSSLSTTLADYVTDTSLSATLSNYVLVSALSAYALSADINFQSGNTWSLSDRYVTGGFMSDARKSLYFSVPLPKNMGSLTPTVTVMKLNARNTAGGYCFGSYVAGGVDIVNGTGYTITTTKSSENTLYCYIATTSTMSGTTNTPVSISVEALTISFA